MSRFTDLFQPQPEKKEEPVVQKSTPSKFVAANPTNIAKKKIWT